MIQFPSDFLATLPLPEPEKEKFSKALQESPPVSVRIHPEKFAKELSLEKVAWCNEGYYLPQRPVFTFDPVFHSGGYYVQEASSMVIGELVKEIVSENEIRLALDLCAAPGGKSTHLLSTLPPESLLISNEVVSSRLGALGENITKWGNANVAITHNDPSHFTALENLFDLILVDAPCSGEGMFRKEEAAIAEWSLKNVAHCAMRQKKILSDILPALKPGGFLIYSTCTYNEKEDEENVNYLLESDQLEMYPVKKKEWQTQTGLFRFYPHRVKGEGLFVAILRKKEGEVAAFRIKKSNFKPVKADVHHLLKKGDWTFFEHKESVSFFPSAHIDLMEALKKQLRFYKTGTRLGIKKGNEWIPDHELFLSSHFEKTAFPSFGISYDDAIRFLSREPVSVVPEGRGWAYFTYAGFPLGAFKMVPGRLNNYFPKELKIRKKYEDSARFSLHSL